LELTNKELAGELDSKSTEIAELLDEVASQRVKIELLEKSSALESLPTQDQPQKESELAPTEDVPCALLKKFSVDTTSPLAKLVTNTTCKNDIDI
jgi:hypothetical protein